MVYAVTRSVPGTPESAVPYVPPPPKPVLLWVGDSYALGTGASGPGAAESCLTARALGFTCALDAQSDTGYVADGHSSSKAFAPLIDRVSTDLTKFQAPAVVVIDSGRNDPPGTRTEQAASAYFDRVTEAFPQAKVALIAPYYLGSTSLDFASLRSWMKAQASNRDWLFVDPLAEGWPQNLGYATIGDHVHPDPHGHQVISQHLVTDLEALATG
jgi:hypothetical protein